MQITVETPALTAAIHGLHARAFPSDAEARLVDRLRGEGALALSLVALDGDTVVGHAAFSPMSAPFRALGLAPVATAPSHRRRGVAAALIGAGLAQAAQAGWEGVFVLGDAAYYGRFGFDAAAAAPFAAPYAGPHFMLRALKPDLPAHGGDVAYAPAFDSLA